MDDFAVMDRRALLQRTILLLGAGALASCDLLPVGKAGAAALDNTQRKLLEAFADTLIPATATPGALAAGVPEVLAQLYAEWAAPATREALAGALSRLDAAAQSQAGKGFLALDAAARQRLLAAHDKAALVPVPAPPGAHKGTLIAPAVFVQDIGYHRLKELVVCVHYASRAGLSAELDYQHYPGPWQPSVTVTAAPKPAAGPNP
jgi:gluconate 2-dehydrogenase gamma chain